jgi:hypothetical protein
MILAEFMTQLIHASIDFHRVHAGNDRSVFPIFARVLAATINPCYKPEPFVAISLTGHPNGGQMKQISSLVISELLTQRPLW